MINKHALFIIASLCVVSSVSASGPLSGKSGLGTINHPVLNNLSGLAGSGLAVRDPELFHPLNPSQWVFSRKTHIISSFNWEGFKQSGSAGEAFYSGFGYLGTMLVFPVKADWSVGFSLLPFSRSDYEINQLLDSPDGSVTSTYYGSGGLSVLRAGAGYRLSADWSVGASFDYYFGIISKNRTVAYSTGINSYLSDSYKVYGYGLTLSATTFLRPDWIGEKELLTGAVSVQLPFGLNGTRTQYEYSDLIGDTTQTVTDVTGSLPFTLLAGLAYSYDDRLTIAGDLVFSTASSIDLPKNEANPSNDVLTLRTGLSYIPDNSPGARFTNRIRYKAGFSGGLSHVVFSGIQQDEWGLSSGVGLPLPGLGSVLDVGGDVIWRGYLAGTQYKDQVYRLNIGINLTELWFQKRLID